MSEPLIEISHLCKSFTMDLAATRSLKTAVLGMHRREIVTKNVLDDVSFKIDRGESVAMVGRNGAGKSTLLTVIAGVYKPTSGECIVRGRVAPLLELGAGFHTDLSGLDNLIMNGMFMGLTKKEVLERQDSIIDFADLREYIKQPTRKYSSGMVARLGFAIAAHSNADILIVDEVLSVGDFLFQRKCEDYLRSFVEQGGTLLFVSHSGGVVQKFAKRSIWLKDGHVQMDGESKEVSRAYEAEL